METKQTAVEWLIEKITNRVNGVLDDCSFMSLDEIYEQAKEMEKEQMIDMWIKGNTTFIFNKTAQQYYNETYGKE
jgi:hypothetical protein